MLKNSKVVLFLLPYKVGQAGNFWTLLRKILLLSRFFIFLFPSLVHSPSGVYYFLDPQYECGVFHSKFRVLS